ncbi:DUF6350 family protein [Janibacter sp. G56]|uniref:cell division protein PerM n=1 Tax=Janibacter sp. G56 TaxID=3418717 RepID=UPI003D021985
MTVMEMFRAATTQPRATRDLGGRWTAPVLGGALTALLGWLVVTALVTLGVLTAPHSQTSFGSAVGGGSAVWLLLGGARLGVGDAVVAFTPLLGLAGVVALAALGFSRSVRWPDDDDVDDAAGDGPIGIDALAARSDADDTDSAEPFEPADPEDPRTWAAWLGGWIVVGVLAWLVTLAGPVRPVAITLLLPFVLAPALGAAWVLHRRGDLDDLLDRLPSSVQRALRPGLQGAAALLVMGTTLIALAVVFHFSRVAHVQAELGAGLLGGLVLTLAQVLALPNLGLWGVSFLAGPGFDLAEGAHAGWGGAETSLLPLIPVFAAHPEPGGFPVVTRLLVLLPVIAGAYVARRVLGSMSRLASPGVKVATVGSAVVVAVAALVALDAVGGGSLGAARLSDVGAPAAALGLALLLELGIGAAVVLGRDVWRLRR